MQPSKRQITILALAFALSATALWAVKNKEKDASRMGDRQRALHALSRLTFGPRPGDVDRVMSMGVDKWIDQQLHPDKIDDSALNARLAPLRTLNMVTRQLVLAFPPPQIAKVLENGRMSLPSDPAERAIYQAQI